MPEKTDAPLHMPVLWAQREKLLYVTLDVEDFHIDELKIEGTKLTCKGYGGAAKKHYHCDLEFFGDVDGEKFTRAPGDRSVQLVIPKKLSDDGSGKWWPRLLKVSGKVPWVKTDFNKWKDEDDEDSDAEGGPGGNFDLNAMMSKMGGAGGMGGMGGMPGMGGGMGDYNFDDDDSDAEDLPDLENGDDDEEQTGGEGKTKSTSNESTTSTTAAGDIGASPSTSGEVAS